MNTESAEILITIWILCAIFNCFFIGFTLDALKGHQLDIPRSLINAVVLAPFSTVITIAFLVRQAFR